MAQTYKVVQVSSQEPKTWQGPHGLVYYIKVRLEGHDKPVEIGKKASNAINVGDEVYGTITAGKFDTDKFKAEQNPNGGSASTGNFGGRTSKGYQPNEHAIAKSVALKAAVDYKNGDQRHMQPEDVLKDAQMFLEWLESDEQPATTHDEPQPEQSGYEKAKAQAEAIKTKQEPTNTMTDFNGEEIDLDAIPF